MHDQRAIGAELEEAGWLQGTTIHVDAIAGLLKEAGVIVGCDIETLCQGEYTLILATQSCDVSNNDLSTLEHVEFSVGRFIDNVNGNFTHNKNPRKLHTCFNGIIDEAPVLFSIELLAKERVFISKQALADSELAPEHQLENLELDGFEGWHACRYKRPALPTMFNDLLIAADRKNKRKKHATKLAESLTGVYVEIIPFRDLHQDEKYKVNLLGLMEVGSQLNADQQAAFEHLAKVMEAAGMDVKSVLKSEDQVSVALLRTRFKRFYYDDLSYRLDDPLLPVEVVGDI